jgi:hypothetical protein
MRKHNAPRVTRSAPKSGVKAGEVVTIPMGTNKLPIKS